MLQNTNNERTMHYAGCLRLYQLPVCQEFDFKKQFFGDREIIKFNIILVTTLNAKYNIVIAKADCKFLTSIIGIYF